MSEQNNVTEQQSHLQSAVTQQQKIVDEINSLSNQLVIKREQATKLQGIIEYLNGIGVKLPENTEVSPEFTSEDPNS
jgi:predicted type IV restriction endonuclease